jgi:hypothetical protein
LKALQGFPAKKKMTPYFKESSFLGIL